MTRRLLDLYCGQGGAAMGYALAGFAVTGVDTNRANGRYYPFSFVHGDALEYAKEHGHEYDVIHASPPCQRYTIAILGNPEARDRHADLIGPTRDVLNAIGKPYVIENVPRSPLYAPLVLCGTMFRLVTVDDDFTYLRLRRHRWFESNVWLWPPCPCDHEPDAQYGGVYGGGRSDRQSARHIRRGGYTPRVELRAELMGIDWPMTQAGLSEAIPPAYTEWIGSQL